MLSLVVFSSNTYASSSKGQKIIIKKLKKDCGFDGGKLALKHTQDEWSDIIKDGNLGAEIKKICPDVNIIDDPAFQSSSEIFKAQCVQLKMLGLAKVDHKSPISKADMELLYSSGVFSLTKPSSLQKKVFF